MEEKYGKKLGTAKTMFIACSGVMMVAFAFLIAGVAVLGTGLSKGSFHAVCVPLLVVGLGMLFYCIRVLKGNVTCYENGIVIQEAFGKKELPREDIAAIYWERPGANVSNSKAPQTNTTTGEIIMKGGHQTYKIRDSYYANIDVLGSFQDKYKIPQEMK